MCCFNKKFLFLFIFFITIFCFCFQKAHSYSYSEKTLFSKYKFEKLSEFQGYRDNSSTATLLNDGRVLFTGGYYNNATTEIYDPKVNKFIKTSDMNSPRKNHSAVLLSDGNVLITGGNNKTDKKLKSAEIYNVKENKFVAIGDMITPKIFHKMFLLENENVLVVDGSLQNIELFDMKTKTFSKFENLKLNSDLDHYLIKQSFYINKDKVLLILGSGSLGKPINIAMIDLKNITLDVFQTNIKGSSSCIAQLNSEELLFADKTTWDKAQQIFKIPILNISDMKIREIKAYEKTKHVKSGTAITLDDNNIILLGGSRYHLGFADIYEKSEVINNTKLYIKSKNEFIDFKNMIYKRTIPQYVKLKNGNYIIYGGYTDYFHKNGYDKNLQPELLVVKK
jgi:hypothetical protein